jgi:hypothetical protein
MDNRRNFSRILFATEAVLHQGAQSWDTHILDLSLNGALVEEPAHFLPKDKSCRLSFFLPGSEVEIQMEAQLVHQNNRQLGLKCTHIDVDSISHLRRMMELNTGDASLLDRELSLFISQHDKTLT